MYTKRICQNQFSISTISRWLSQFRLSGWETIHTLFDIHCRHHWVCPCFRGWQIVQSDISDISYFLFCGSLFEVRRSRSPKSLTVSESSRLETMPYLPYLVGLNASQVVGGSERCSRGCDSAAHAAANPANLCKKVFANQKMIYHQSEPFQCTSGQQILRAQTSLLVHLAQKFWPHQRGPDRVVSQLDCCRAQLFWQTSQQDNRAQFA